MKKDDRSAVVYRKCELCGALLDVSGFNHRKKYCTKCSFIAGKRRDNAQRQLVQQATYIIKRKGIMK